MALQRLALWKLYCRMDGIMAQTTDKLRRGFTWGGMSPVDDMETGGASYFFTRLKYLAAGLKIKAKRLLTIIFHSTSGRLKYLNSDETNVTRQFKLPHQNLDSIVLPLPLQICIAVYFHLWGCFR